MTDGFSLSPEAWRRRHGELEELGARGTQVGAGLESYRSDERIWGNPRAAAAAHAWLATTGAAISTSGANITETGYRAGATAGIVQATDEISAAELAAVAASRR